MKVGILGGGQLARMLALAGMPLGIEFYFFEREVTRCVQHLGPITVGSFTDESMLHQFAAKLDVITFESENIPPQTLEFLLENYSVRPGLPSLVTGQNRVREKALFDQLNIKTVNYRHVQTAIDLQHAAEQLGYPFIVKTVSGGYDGKGQFRVREKADLSSIPFDRQVTYLAEGWVEFDYEISCVAVRSQHDEIRFYDLCHNQHEEGILRTTFPCQETSLNVQAHDYTARIMRELDHVGVLTVEYFVQNHQLIANEIAPRVHNTGHWTIE